MGIHTNRPRNGLSLCAGYGGLDMGLQLAEPDFETRAYVEWDKHAQAGLIAAQSAGYFAPAPIWDDLCSFDGKPWRSSIDTILAGYPCQPFSQAGQRKGADDERHLWPEVARIIGEVGPEWVFLENVAGHVSLGLESVLRELWDLGLTPAVGLFSAAETGATHERLRMFIVAHRQGDDGRGKLQSRDAGRGRAGSSGGSAKLAASDGGNTRAERQFSGRQFGFQPESGRIGAGCAGLANTGQPRPQGLQQPGSPYERHWQAAPGSIAERGCPRLYPPGPGASDQWAEIIRDHPYLAPATSIGDCFAGAKHVAALEEGPKQAAAQSALCRMAHGLASRSRALRGLGNGVVPLAAAYAWRSLATAHGLRALDLEAASRSDSRTADEPVLTNPEIQRQGGRK